MYKTLIPRNHHSIIMNSSLSNSDKNKAFSILAMTIRRTNDISIGYKATMKNSVLKEILGRVSTPKKFLIDKGILLTNRSYVKGVHSFRFTVNYELGDGDCTPIIVSNPKINEYDSVEDATLLNLSRLIINEKELKIIANKMVSEITLDSFVLDHNPNQKKPIEVTNMKTGKKFFTKIKDILEDCEKYGYDLIKDGKYYFFCKKEEYLKIKRGRAKFNYYLSITKMAKKDFFATRNSTNNRLDSNITNMPTRLFNKIVEDNNLVDIDISNSQLAILSSILKKNKIKGNSTKEFIKASENGLLYELIQEKLGYSTRKKAKTTVFEIIFSKKNNRSADCIKFKKLFPEISKFIYDYKNKNGNNSFAILMQSIESKLFIDGILKEVIIDGKFCLTRHDSVIVKKEDESYIKEKLVKHLEKESIIANFKTH